MKIKKEILSEYVKQGLLYKQIHPELDLTIYNYTAKVQYEKLWDEITAQCRGLILNSFDNVVCRCLKKFKNYNEYTLNEIPNLPFQVFEKMDGSLIQLFWYNDQWVVSSRGSFTSDHAGWAWKIIKNKYIDCLDKLDKANAYIFELLWPEGRIVLDYKGVKDLILLAVINTQTGEEILTDDPIVNTWGLTPVKKYDGVTDYNTLKDIIANDKEGFVIRFSNGFRMKIKGDEYCRLHKMMTNITSKDVWTAFCDGMTFEKFIEPLPDEMFAWVNNIWKQMESQETDRLKDCIVIWHNIKNKLGESQTKKDWAIEIQKEDPSVRAILFFLVDGRVSEARNLIKKRFCMPELQKCWMDKDNS